MEDPTNKNLIYSFGLFCVACLILWCLVMWEINKFASVPMRVLEHIKIPVPTTPWQPQIGTGIVTSTEPVKTQRNPLYQPPCTVYRFANDFVCQ